MKQIIRYELNVSQKILMVLATFFVAFVISQAISYYIPELFLGGAMNIMKIKPEMVKETNILKIMLFLSSTILFVLPPIVISIFFKRNIKEYLKLNNCPNFIFFVLIFIFMGLAYPLLSLIVEWNQSVTFPASLELIERMLRTMEETNNTLVISILSGSNWYDLVANLIVIALVPAIGEELVFRGLIQKYFIKFLKNTHISILITAFIFSAIHFSFFGFIPRFILGLFLGYLTVRFSSLLPSIFAHFVNNATAVCFAFYLAKTNRLVEIEETNYYPENTIIFIAITLLAVLVGLLIFWKLKTNKNSICSEKLS